MPRLSAVVISFAEPHLSYCELDPGVGIDARGGTVIGETQRLIVRLASVLASLRDVDSLTARLCEAGRQMLSADGAGLRLVTPSGVRVLMWSTDELSAQLEEVQDVVDQGPTFDAMSTRTVLIASFEAGDDTRWPMMMRHGAGAAFAGVIIVVPLIVDGRVIGALTAHRQQPERADDRDIAAFLGAALSAPLLHDPALGLDEHAPTGEWPSQSLVHQATGMIVAQVGVLPRDALALLKGQAFAQDVTLSDVAEQIVRRETNFRHFTIKGD